RCRRADEVDRAQNNDRGVQHQAESGWPADRQSAECGAELSVVGESIEQVPLASGGPRTLDTLRAGTFVASVLTSAFLLFLLQPMLGRILLPVFGGSPAVWNTCMVFFQVLLLAGYAYAPRSLRQLCLPRQ